MGCWLGGFAGTKPATREVRTRRGRVGFSIMVWQVLIVCVDILYKLEWEGDV
jgi:hypothetical protein